MQVEIFFQFSLQSKRHLLAAPKGRVAAFATAGLWQGANFWRRGSFEARRLLRLKGCQLQQVLPCDRGKSSVYFRFKVGLLRGCFELGACKSLPPKRKAGTKIKRAQKENAPKKDTGIALLPLFPGRQRGFESAQR